MTRMLFALPLAVPALAALPLPAHAAEADLARTAAQLQDPHTQDVLAGTLSALVAAMLDIEVGGIANAAAKADPRGRIREVDPNLTLGELAAHDNPDFADDLDADVRSGTRMAGALAGAMAAMLPQLETLARDVEDRVVAARDRARR